MQDLLALAYLNETRAAPEESRSGPINCSDADSGGAVPLRVDWASSGMSTPSLRRVPDCCYWWELFSGRCYGTCCATVELVRVGVRQHSLSAFTICDARVHYFGASKLAIVNGHGTR
jgi:hypothetical protein